MQKFGMTQFWPKNLVNNELNFCLNIISLKIGTLTTHYRNILTRFDKKVLLRNFLHNVRLEYIITLYTFFYLSKNLFFAFIWVVLVTDTYDCIVCSGGLCADHIPSGALKEMVRITKPGILRLWEYCWCQIFAFVPNFLIGTIHIIRCREKPPFADCKINRDLILFLLIFANDILLQIMKLINSTHQFICCLLHLFMNIKASVHSFKHFNSPLLKESFSLYAHITSDEYHAWFHLNAASPAARNTEKPNIIKNSYPR